jgi:hypothetical protein
MSATTVQNTTPEHCRIAVQLDPLPFPPTKSVEDTQFG